MTADVRLGTQGWNYSAWVGPMYPSGSKASEFLEIYARAFNTVEVDATFYAVPAAATVRDWGERTPADFRFSLKLPREITHDNGLRNSEAATDVFFDRARELGDKLGAVLVQLPPGFGPAQLPALVSFLPTLPSREIPVAIEFRQRGWVNDGVLALLADYNVAFAFVDARWIPRKTVISLAERPTADFTYLRWMGPDRNIVDYSHVRYDRTRELESWATVIRSLTSRVKTVYGYVNNHFAGHSPASVRQLQTLLGMESVDPDQLGEQLRLL